jgi:polyhydroxyalkanoate synthase
VATKTESDRYLDPDTWLRQTPDVTGSWWPEWAAWLAARSGPPVEAPAMGPPGRGLAPLDEAPGTYVLQT